MSSQPLTIPFDAFEKMVQNAHAKGANKGQAHLIYFLYMILKGYLGKEALSQNDIDSETWNRLQEIIETITPPAKA